MCGHRAATIADHVQRARVIVATLGQEEFYNPERIQGLCKLCHDSKTATEVGWAGAHGEATK
jgi:5-methylcytosine-specific restriction endonuclease McrA